MDFVFHPVTDELAVAPQLTFTDLQPLVDAGFKSLIINRPDEELEAGQPSSEVMIQAAQAVGLQVRYQPVVSGSITPDNVLEFKQLLTELPKPVLAYCRSGTRCLNLFHLSNKN